MLDMKAPFVAVLLLISVVSAHSASQKNVSEGPVLKQIVVRVLNGTDSRPIKHQTLGTRLGSDRQRNYRTNDNGEVIVMIGDSKGTDIAVWLTNFYIDCELPADWDGQTTRFSLSEITSKGSWRRIDAAVRLENRQFRAL